MGVGPVRGAHAIHYLDDYLLMAPPCTDECGSALRTCLRMCESLGVPMADHKISGPATVLSFLGIEIDTDAGALRLPQEKLHRLRGLIASWSGRKSCTKRELLSSIGQLQHACRVVRPGRTFLRTMIDLSTVAKVCTITYTSIPHSGLTCNGGSCSLRAEMVCLSLRVSCCRPPQPL